MPSSYCKKLRMPDKKTLGKLPRDAIRLLELPRLPAEIVDGFKA